MPKKPDELDGFSIEEIIAEIKSAPDGEQPPIVATPKDSDAIIDQIARELLTAADTAPPDRPPRPEPVPFTPPKAEVPAAAPPKGPPITFDTGKIVQVSVPSRDPDDSDVKAATPPGRRLKPAPPSEGQRILEEEARRAAEERRRLQAPWRTRREKVYTDPPDVEDTQEFEIVLDTSDPDTGTFGTAAPATGEPDAPRPPDYDFVNRVYEDAQTAVRHLDKRMVSMAARILLLLPLLVLSAYMTLCLPRGWPMPFGFEYYNYPYLYLLLFAVIQVLAIVLSSEVTAAGLMRMLRLRPTLDSLVLFGQLCVLAHTISIVFKPQWGGYLPYTCPAVLTCLIALLAKRQRVESLRRTYRASLLGTVPTAVKLVEDGDLKLAVKTEEGVWVDMETIAKPDPTERLSEYLAPIAIVAVIALAIAASFGQQQPHSLLWCLAALSMASAPVSLVLSASMPTRKLSKKLFTSGSGLINPGRTRQLARCDAAVLRDADLFPAGSVEINGMKIAANQKKELVLGCATAMVQEIGGGLARAFSEFSRQQYIPVCRARNMRFHESGGISAEIDGHYALLGSASFLMRMGVRVTEGVKLPSSLFLAVDSAFAGIFSIKYGIQSQPYAAFRVLRTGKVTPLVATRDVNITQAFVESRFDLRAGATEHPELPERIRLSEPELGGQRDTLAFLSRDGMFPFAEAVVAAKKQQRAIRFGQMIGIAALAAGLMLMYFLATELQVSAAAPHNVLLYLLLWLVPSCLGSLIITKM